MISINHSPSLSLQVIAYMMKEYQMPLTEAKKHVKSIRSCTNPNDGFMGQLRSYEGILTARYGGHASSVRPFMNIICHNIQCTCIYSSVGRLPGMSCISKRQMPMSLGGG